MARKTSKDSGVTSDGGDTSVVTPHLDELVALASAACQDEMRVLELRIERAHAIRDLFALCAAFEKKLHAFRQQFETEREHKSADEVEKPSATVTSRRTEAIRRLAKTYQKLKAQLGPTEQKAVRAVFKSSGITAAIREAREMIHNGKKRPAPTPPAPVERRPSAEERLVRAKLAVLRAYAKRDELKRAAALHDLDDMLPREFEISRTRIEELYQETQGARRPFFVRDLVRLVPDAERVEILAELGGLYDMSLALLVQEAEATASDEPRA